MIFCESLDLSSVPLQPEPLNLFEHILDKTMNCCVFMFPFTICVPQKKLENYKHYKKLPPNSQHRFDEQL